MLYVSHICSELVHSTNLEVECHKYRTGHRSLQSCGLGQLASKKVLQNFRAKYWTQLCCFFMNCAFFISKPLPIFPRMLLNCCGFYEKPIFICHLFKEGDLTKSRNMEDQQVIGSSNVSIESSIISLDESLKSSNLSNQCEFRYQNGKRCPTSAEHKYTSSRCLLLLRRLHKAIASCRLRSALCCYNKF